MPPPATLEVASLILFLEMWKLRHREDGIWSRHLGCAESGEQSSPEAPCRLRRQSRVTVAGDRRVEIFRHLQDFRNQVGSPVELLPLLLQVSAKKPKKEFGRERGRCGAVQAQGGIGAGLSLCVPEPHKGTSSELLGRARGRRPERGEGRQSPTGGKKLREGRMEGPERCFWGCPARQRGHAPHQH